MRSNNFLYKRTYILRVKCPQNPNKKSLHLFITQLRTTGDSQVSSLDDSELNHKGISVIQQKETNEN